MDELNKIDAGVLDLILHTPFILSIEYPHRETRQFRSPLHSPTNPC